MSMEPSQQKQRKGNKTGVGAYRHGTTIASTPRIDFQWHLHPSREVSNKTNNFN